MEIAGPQEKLFSRKFHLGISEQAGKEAAQTIVVEGAHGDDGLEREVKHP